MDIVNNNEINVSSTFYTYIYILKQKKEGI